MKRSEEVGLCPTKTERAGPWSAGGTRSKAGSGSAVAAGRIGRFRAERNPEATRLFRRSPL
jgi:hypothetical protein